MVAVGRVDEDRVDRGLVPSTAEPLVAARVVPQRLDQLPAVTVVVGAKQAAGLGTDPQAAGLVLACWRKGPQQTRGGGFAFLDLGALGVRGCRHLLPVRARITGAMQFAAP